MTPPGDPPVTAPPPDLLAEVLDALPERVARYRLADRVIVYCNDAWAAGHGITPAQCIGRPLDDLLSPQELEGMHRQLAVLGPRNPLLTDPDPRAAPDDSTLLMEWIDRLVPGPDGHEVLSVGRDVTARHRAQQRAHASEQRLRLAMSRAPIGMVIVDLDDHLVEVNRALCAFLGRPAEDLVGWPWQEFTHPDDVEAVQRRIKDLLAHEETSYSIEHRYLHADGSTRWGLLTGTFVRDPHGRPLHAIGQIVDITDRKLAEQQAARRADLLRLAGSIARLGGWSWEEPSDEVICSDVVCEILGIPIGTRLGIDEALAMCPGRERDRVEAAIRACLTDGTPWDVEHRLVTATGERRWVRSTGEASRNEQGRVTRLWGAMQDITSQKDAEGESGWLAEQLTAMLRSTDDGFLTLDHDGRITYVNDRGARIIGRSREQLLGQNLLATFPHLRDTKLPTAFQAAERDGETVHISRDYDPRLDVWFETDIHPSSRGLVIYFRDITHHIERQAALERSLAVERDAAQRLRELDQAKNAFLSAVSHELRTPLTVVHGLALSLQRLRGDLDPRVRTRIEDAVVTHADHLRQLLDDLLDVDRLARGTLQATRERFDASPAIHAVVAASSVAERTRVDAPDRLPTDADRVQLERIIRNLLENAAKYAPDGPIAVRAAGRDDHGIRLEVIDAGPGIPQGQLERIFEPFHRVDDAHPQPGTGVGLALVADFARIHGGRAWAENLPGGGARFVVEIPGEGRRVDREDRDDDQ